MLRDLGGFVQALFRSWWARIGIVNGVVSYTGRVFDLGPINPYIGPLFVCLGVACLGISILSVYHEQKQEIRRLQVLLSDRAEMTTILVDKLRGEVLNNIEHLSESAMLHDDAWRAIRPDDLKHLPRQIRNLSSGFYTDLRSWKKLLNAADPRESAIKRRQDFRKQLGFKGQELYDALLKPLTSIFGRLSRQSPVAGGRSAWVLRRHSLGLMPDECRSCSRQDQSPETPSAP